MAKRRRAPKVWRTASGQMMQRSQPAYIPPEQMPAILQIGMFNVSHDGEAALALPAEPDPEPVAARAAVEAVPIDPDAPIIEPPAAPQHTAQCLYISGANAWACAPDCPIPAAWNHPGQGLALMNAVLDANPLFGPKLEQIADAQAEAAAPKAKVNPAAKVKKLRKNANIAAIPQVWPDDPPPGYIVKMVHGTCYQPVRLSDPDHPDGIYFVLLDLDADGFGAKYCSTRKAAIDWLWCVALGNALAAAAEGVRVAIYRAAEAASAAEHGTEGASGTDRPPVKRRRSSKRAS